MLSLTSVRVKIEVLAARIQDLVVHAGGSGGIVGFAKPPDARDFQLGLLAIRWSWEIKD